MPKLLILSNFPIPELQERHLGAIHACAQGYDIVETDERERQLLEIRDAEVVFGTVLRDLYLVAERLRWVQAVGAGIDRMLYPEFVQSDVVLTSEKGLVGVHLAEHAFALLLALTRGLHRALRAPVWETRFLIRERAWELQDKTLGIVGLGGTGQAVGARAAAFGMRVIAVEPEPVSQPPWLAWLGSPDEIDELLSRCDVVVICAPLTPRTRHLFNCERFARMKRGAILINVTRGELIDESALIAALDSGQLAGAGLDTAPGEPLPPNNPLWRMENVIVTPHVAGASPRRGDRIVELFCENLHRYQRGEALMGVIDKTKGY